MLKKNVPSAPAPRRGLFAPVLAGATLKERLLACLGALVGIFLTSLICSTIYGHSANIPLVVAPIGASAVLLFAVPTSPLAQPWPIIGGNVLSATIGVCVAHLIDHTVVAAGLAVSLAILAMSLARCLHPPGGAAALTAVVGGPAITGSGFLFPLFPVGLNSLILIVVGIAFHRLSRRNYPHLTSATPSNIHGTQDPPSQNRVGFQSADVDTALALLDETFDIDPIDLERLLRQVELEALVRSHANITCGEIMSRDVISVTPESAPASARMLLLRHNLRLLPVSDARGVLRGVVGLRELTAARDRVEQLMSAATTALEDDPALSLVAALTDGRAHAAVIVDDKKRVRGMITQTDLLALLAHQMRTAEPEKAAANF